jgi:hypothetical protein
MVSCFSMLLLKSRVDLPLKDSVDIEQSDVSTLTPGAYSFIPEMHSPKPYDENLTLDLNELKKQYKCLTERQNQAFIIIKNANEQHTLKISANALSSLLTEPSSPPIKTTTYIKKGKHFESLDASMTDSSSIYNHLLFKTNDNSREPVIFNYIGKSINQKVFIKNPLKNDESDEEDVFENTLLGEHCDSISTEVQSVVTKHQAPEVIPKNSNPKLFNPLKVKPLNSSIAKNGMRLGLYK